MKRIFTTLTQKWPEYLLEILVITMGILGAFALNNWNEASKEEIDRQKLYHQLFLDYEANLSQLNDKINLHTIIVGSCSSLLKAYDEPKKANLDKILNDLSILGIDPTFDPIVNDLSNSGKINLVENVELNRLLSNWGSDIVALRELELVWSHIDYNAFEERKNKLGIGRSVHSKFWSNEAINNQWILGKESNFHHSIPGPKRSISKEKILTDYELEGVISMAMLTNQAALSQADVLKERIERILFLINKEIE